MKVLVADDESEIRGMLMDFLTLHGIETLEAANGLEALLRVKHGAPDAVLLDLRMPRLGGIEALKRIRTFNPAIRIVVITAEVDTAIHEQARAGGAHAVLEKPVHLPDILAALGHRAAAEAPAPAAPPAGTMPAPPAAAAAHVLVVDDDAEVRDTLVDFLTSRNYRVSVAADGASAVRTIAETIPDVILLDIDMPGLKGTDALPTIRAMAPQTIVIMVSGTEDDAVAKRALALGAFDYVVKPVDYDYLATGLDSALALKALDGP
jgi:CheY-like chemotaxis protein